MNVKMLKNISMTIGLAIFVTSVSAIGLPGFKKDKKESSGNAAAQQEALVKAFSSAANDIRLSDSMLLEAFGFKEDAEIAKAEANAHKSGSVLSSDQIKSFNKRSENNKKLIEKAMKENKALSKDGQKLYAKAFIPFVSGLAKTTKLKDQFSPFIKSAQKEIKNASFMNISKVKSKLEAGMIIATEGPGFIAGLFSTSADLIGYAKDNGIELPKDATAEMADL